jgi:excisionase family DNA binding protein
MSEQRVTMSEAQFAKAVGLSRVTLWRLRQKGLVPHYRIGTKILYGQQHVDEFLKANENTLNTNQIKKG